MEEPGVPENPDILEELDLRADTESLRILGAVKKPFSCEYSRDLTAADLEALSSYRGVAPRSLIKIHTSHHALAKCLASGMKQSQAALVTGYTANRVSILMADPAFITLVDDYRNEMKGAFADLAERMTNISLDAIEILQERLHDNPETFSADTLLDVIKVMADRTGHGPGQNINVRHSTDFIDRPPRESYEEWAERRMKQIEAPREDSRPEVLDLCADPVLDEIIKEN